MMRIELTTDAAVDLPLFPETLTPTTLTLTLVFLERCADNGEIAKRFAQMPVGRLLRSGCNQHTLGPDDLPRLRDKAKRCIKVCDGMD